MTSSTIRVDQQQQFENCLIEEVRARPYLYDHSHPKNKDIVTKAVAWKEISKLCGVSAERCLSRWKSLRDRYLREWKISRSSNKTTKWIYFNSLQFLERHLKTVTHISLTSTASHKRPSVSNEQSTSRMNEDSMEAEEQEHDYSNENFNVKQEVQEMTSIRESNLQRGEKSRLSKNDGGDGTSDILDEPEIEFDVVGTVSRFNDTIRAYKEVATLRLQRTEEENFGALVADMLSTLTVERRTRAKAHLMQYLAELHLQQITQ